MTNNEIIPGFDDEKDDSLKIKLQNDFRVVFSTRRAARCSNSFLIKEFPYNYLALTLNELISY